MTKIALAHDHLFQIGGAENVLVVLSSMHKEAPIFTLINNPKINFNQIGRKLGKKYFFVGFLFFLWVFCFFVGFLCG